MGVLGECNKWSDILKLFKLVKRWWACAVGWGAMRAKMALVDVTPQAEAGLTSTCSTLWMGGVARLLRDELWHCMTRKERRLGAGVYWFGFARINLKVYTKRLKAKKPIQPCRWFRIAQNYQKQLHRLTLGLPAKCSSKRHQHKHHQGFFLRRRMRDLLLLSG